MTLDKSGHAEDFQYHDRFINPTEFEWLSQNRTTQDSADGKAIRNHTEQAIAVHLFEMEEAPGVPFNDVVEVSNYVAAMEHGLARLGGKEGGLPLSNRLLREIHGKLMARGRGAEKEPGEFRRSQNWIGGTRSGNAQYVPPPPHLVADCMASLERFLHDPDIPALIKAALAHVQFETIHPFLDGNADGAVDTVHRRSAD